MKAISQILILFICLFRFGQIGITQGNEKLIEAGYEAFEKERYVESIDYFTKVLYPVDLDDNLGYVAYEVRGNIKEIARDSNNVLLPPENPTENEKIVMHKMAEAFQKMNDYESAEVWFRNAVKYPLDEFPYSRFFYAETFMQNHKYDSAQIQFNRFITEDIVNPENKFYSLAETKILSCAFAKDSSNLNEVFTVEQSDSVLNFSATSYSMRQVSPKYYVFSAIPSDKDQRFLIDTNDRHLLAIYLVEKKSDGTFEKPEKLPFSINSSGRHQGSVSISPNGNRIYFTRVNSLNRSDTKIYFSTKKNNTWQLPKPLNQFVNFENFKSLDPYLTSNGKQLFFASNMPGGEGGLDIWVSDLDKDGFPINQQNIGFNVNTPEDEVSPFMHESTKALYYASKGKVGFGGYDIFLAKWDYNLDWYKMSYNVGAPVNSSRNDSHFMMDKDLQDGFLTSDRNECLNCGSNKTRIEFCNKLYHIHKEVLNFVVEGYVFDEETRLPIGGATVVFKDIAQSKEPLLVKTDETGYYKLILEPEMDYFAKASMMDYFADQALLSTMDDVTSKTYRQNFYLEKIPEGEIAIEGIEYDYNKATLRPVSVEVLDKLVEFLELNDNLSVEIRSHTDYRGSEPYNMRLSDARAKSVVDYLIEQGIDYERLKPKGYGESTPAEIQNDNGDVVTLSKAYIDALPTNDEMEVAHQRNRRTAFKVLGQ
ncbi:MAG: OmpA family protein [Crocinitomicaceae bacterium]